MRSQALYYRATSRASNIEYVEDGNNSCVISSFTTGQLVGVEGDLGVFLVRGEEAHAVSTYIRGSLSTSIREDVMSLDRFIKLSLGR